MTQERDYVDYLEDILDAAERAVMFVSQMTYEDFFGDEKTS
jgi:uncharacterized protein with HEPN domain